VLSADRLPHFERLAYALTERVSDTDRLTQLRAHGLLAPVRSAALAAFGRQSDYALYPGVAVLAGSAGVSILPPPAFADVWEFVDWGRDKAARIGPQVPAAVERLTGHLMLAVPSPVTGGRSPRWHEQESESALLSGGLGPAAVGAEDAALILDDAI
jgi:hypothetical protein